VQNSTPPAVTQRLRALEARIGIRLIDRSGRKITLTDEGASSHRDGTIVADAMEALSEALSDRHAGHSCRTQCSRDGLSRHAAPIPFAATVAAKRQFEDSGCDPDLAHGLKRAQGPGVAGLHDEAVAGP